MKNKQDKDIEMEIANSVIRSQSDDRIREAKKFLDNLFEFKRVVKLYNTYILGVETALANTKNGRMYVNYNIDGTVTGRLSNSGTNIAKGGGKDSKIGVSFHTLPREQTDFNIRDYVVAPEGWDFITVDMKAMELRVLAHVANERNMIKAFESGIDLHTYSAAMTFGKKAEGVTKEERQIAKEVSFLTVYGGTAFTLANKRNISETKAEKIINNWMAAFPGVKTYMGMVEDYIKQFKYAKTIFGRYRHLPNISSPVKSIQREAFRQGLNFTIQSSASDILLCGLIGINNELKKNKFKAKLIATVHDSVELVSPKDETDKVIRIVHDQLVNYPYMREKFGINMKVPLAVDIEVGTSFGNGKHYDINHPSAS